MKALVSAPRFARHILNRDFFLSRIMCYHAVKNRFISCTQEDCKKSFSAPFYRHFGLFAKVKMHLTFRTSGLDNIFIVPEPSLHCCTNWISNVPSPTSVMVLSRLHVHTGSQIHPVSFQSSGHWVLLCLGKSMGAWSYALQFHLVLKLESLELCLHSYV